MFYIHTYIHIKEPELQIKCTSHYSRVKGKENSKLEGEYRICTQILNLLPKSHWKSDLESRWRIFKVASNQLIRLG